MARVVLLGRAGCHLCDDARLVVQEVCARLGATWEERDVDADPALSRYGELVPVVLVDDVQVGFWRIEPQRLERALEGA